MKELNENDFSAPSTFSAVTSNFSRGLKRPLPMASTIPKKAANSPGDSAYEYTAFPFIINNVAQMLDRNERAIASDIIKVSENQNCKFVLSFNSNPPAPEKTDFATISLILFEHKPFKWQSVQYKIAVLDNNGEEKFFKEGRENLHEQSILWESPVLNIAKAAILDKKNSLIKNDRLTVFCEIRLGYNAVADSQAKVCHDLEKLLKSEKFSDVTIIVQGKLFRVHKAILCARSQVFEAMFKIDCIEKKENKTEIHDVEPNVFMELLNYIYYGQVEMDLLTVADIFEAADKYEILGLKSICEKFLSKHLDMEVVSQVLQLSDMHQSEYLKQACIEFLSDNSEDIDPALWSTLQTYSDITYRLFCDVSKKSKKEEPKTPPSSRCRLNNAPPRVLPQRNGANHHQPHRPNADQNANLPVPGFLFHAFHQQPPEVNFINRRIRPPYNWGDDFFNAQFYQNNANSGMQQIFNYIRNAPGRRNHDNASAAFGPAVALGAAGPGGRYENRNGNPGANRNAGGNDRGNVYRNFIHQFGDEAAVNGDPYIHENANVVVNGIENGNAVNGDLNADENANPVVNGIGNGNAANGNPNANENAYPVVNGIENGNAVNENPNVNENAVINGFENGNAANGNENPPGPNPV